MANLKEARLIFRQGLYILFLVSMVGFCCPSSALAAEKPTITVYGFECKASGGFWHDARWDIGTGMGEMLIDALFETGRFTVVERLNLGDVTFEQDLAAQGRVAAKKAAKMGKITGAQFIARGTITEFDVRKAGGAFGISLKHLGLGLKRQVAHIGGHLRIYDATTSEIYASHRFKKEVPATGIDIGYVDSNVGVSLGGFQKTPLGEATYYAIKDMVAFIVDRLPSEPPSAKITCPKCGTEVVAGSLYCPKCGAAMPKEELVKCPYCNAPLSSGVKFCPECGKQLLDITCESCGAKLAPGVKFCPHCGAKVGEPR